jgi:sugar phosphate isomerase/epimerase
LQSVGYRAAVWPREPVQDVRAYVKAARDADIVIAEVGVWNNPISRDEAERQQAIAYCQERLALADEVGARCCVNVAGSRGEGGSRLHPDNLSQATFDLIVETVRQIIDAVQPKRTFYTLEAMPYMIPDTAERYVTLIEAINRPRFAAHFDPVNWISSPQKYFQNAAFIKECVRQLGPHIKSCHLKDTRMERQLTVHIDEVRPGLGNLDYRILLREIENLSPEMPVILEHLQHEEDYRAAAIYVRSVAAEIGVSL